MIPMTSSERKTGVQGATVAANVKRLMEEQNLNSSSLARKIAEIEQPTELADGTTVKPAKLADLAIRRIVAGERKVDVDDLVLLAYVLGVAPVTLLQPHTDSGNEPVPTPMGEVPAVGVWEWMIGHRRPEDIGYGPMSRDAGYWPEDIPTRRYMMGAFPEWSEETERAGGKTDWVPHEDRRSTEQRIADGEQPMF